MEAKHTPGPWKIEKLPSFVLNKPRYGLVGPTGEFLGWLNKWEDDPEGSAANARLIVAAPDLLEWLTDFIDTDSRHTHGVNCDCEPCTLIAYIKGVRKP